MLGAAPLCLDLRRGQYIRRVDMLWPETEAEDAGGNSAQNGKHIQELEQERRLRVRARQRGTDNPVLHDELQHLGKTHRQRASVLNRLQVVVAQRPRFQRARKTVGGSDGVLDGEIDADPADRRHGVRSITDAEKARPPPLAQPINGNAEKLDVVPTLQLAYAVRKIRRHLHDAAHGTPRALPP